MTKWGLLCSLIKTGKFFLINVMTTGMYWIYVQKISMCIILFQYLHMSIQKITFLPSFCEPLKSNLWDLHRNTSMYMYLGSVCIQVFNVILLQQLTDIFRYKYINLCIFHNIDFILIIQDMHPIFMWFQNTS